MLTRRTGYKIYENFLFCICVYLKTGSERGWMELVIICKKLNKIPLISAQFAARASESF